MAPLSHRYDESSGVLHIRLYGEVSDEDLLDYAAQASQERTQQRAELVDVREVETPTAATATLRDVASMFQKTERRPQEVKVAFVAPSDLSYGLARMYQAMRDSSPVEMRVFREMSQAREWLGLPPE